MPPLAPRPISQLARRLHRLGLPVPRGCWLFLNGNPSYRARRRRPAVGLRRSQLLSIAARRSSRVFWRLYPPITVEAA